MEVSYKCKVCGSQPATHFALIGTFKLPFCPHHSQGYSLCDIQYVQDVSSPEDFERCRKLGSAVQLVTLIEERERWESEEVEARLEKLKKLSIEAIFETFESLAASGKALHIEFENALKQAKSQLSSGVPTHYSPLATLALTSPPRDSIPELYLRDVRSTVSLIRQIALQSAGFVGSTPEQLLRNAFRRQTLVEPKKYYGRPSKPPVLRESNGTYPKLLREGNVPYIFEIAREDYPVKRQKVMNGCRETRETCRICRQVLSPEVYLPLEGHQDCKTCFNCINKCTKTYLKCPLCKVRYLPSVRFYLESHIPGLIKASKRRRELLNSTIPTSISQSSACFECNQTEIPLFHYCPTGEGLCFACCQRIINRFKEGKCGNCQESLGEKVAKGGFEVRKGCLGCEQRVRIEEIARSWKDGGLVKYYCKDCQGKLIEEMWFTAIEDI